MAIHEHRDYLMSYSGYQLEDSTHLVRVTIHNLETAMEQAFDFGHSPTREQAEADAISRGYQLIDGHLDSGSGQLRRLEAFYSMKEV
ncbi:hypothetical protein QU481_04305 [Crenobacter sp. SG2303]|uniref:Uncharacterized protein n=1 Tax=Crenobacter oryzisoli TaxID=3056844 RepID=A0ABT7XKK2_9NEIS|nr:MULTISPECIES: hypothetical protein [unclassified Crenobacter]MDN0074109.1 hypothetical protein [Crenobacter sp. SG2303]MDN0085089.1 hypothetical protein [Crenobacter sp. SG2305]